MIRNSLLILLVIVALLSGCINNDKGAEISGTYTHPYKQYAFSKEQIQEFTFYPDGTFYYWNPVGTNSGVYKIEGRDLIITGHLVSAKFKIQEDGSITDTSKNQTWKKKV